MPKGYKHIFDPIHGNIRLGGALLAVVDTEIFQRLREIKQLGACYYVFPGATHNRFEHCIGVCHLAGVMMRHLRENQPELDITERQIELVSLAGLLHDVGHMCFSHSFDNVLIPKLQQDGMVISNPTHEQRSCAIIDRLCLDGILILSDEERTMVKTMIDPRGQVDPTDPKAFLYEIVNNPWHHLDCDKFDYIHRDSHHLGVVGCKVDYMRLVQTCMVIDGRLCYSQKDTFVLYELFRARYRLHKMVYTHPVVQAIEHMLCDALYVASQDYGLLNHMEDTWPLLTDSIISTLYTTIGDHPAAQLVQRIKRRDLYCHVHTVYNDPRTVHQWIQKMQEETGIEDGWAVSISKVGYTSSKEDPVLSIPLCDKQGARCTTQTRHDCGLQPEEYCETMTRIFCTSKFMLPLAEKCRVHWMV